jgi:hypothetical protein
LNQNRHDGYFWQPFVIPRLKLPDDQSKSKIGAPPIAKASPKLSSTMGESEPAWVKYANAIGILALLTGVIYFNPLGGSPSLPEIPSIPSIPSIFDSFRIQRGPLDELPATLPNGCPAHKFKSVRHLSRAPDIMIIEGFLTPEEADVLVEVAYLTLNSRANLVIHYLKSQRSSAMLTKEI